MESYEKINYAIRPNKRTQRKMIFDALGRYLGIYARRSFQYVGFGSMWFADFFPAHRQLGLRRLVSIEREDGYKRAQFNRPFKCVRVLRGDATDILPTLNWRNPSIVWLDYDYAPERESLQDIGFLSSTLASSSVLIVTFDARPPWPDASGRMEREAAMQRVFGDAAPVPGRRPLSVSRFPALLTSVLWKYLDSLLVKQGRAGDFSWSPLFTFFYRDGAPMITIGGALLNKSDANRLSRARIAEDLFFFGRRDPVTIAIPPLTPKERAEIDRRLPGSHAALPFPLPREQLESYSALYRYYPLLAEIEL